jgi:hypothetical protein
VRRGRVVEPGDDTEGTRDRPPTSEERIEAAAQPPEANADEQTAPEGAPDGAPNQPVDEASNPQAEKNPPGDQPAAANNDAALLTFALPSSEPQDPSPEPLALSATALRWMAPMAGLALAAMRNRGNWSNQVDEALEQAGDREWQRLRRAGRLGRLGKS